MDTFFGDARGIYFNDEPVEIIHVPSAHTDSDIIVYFRKSDVIATGDILVNASYPVIHLENGGGLAGSLDGLNRVIDITIPEFRQQGGTIVIPGHGRLYDEDDVVQYRNMLSIFAIAFRIPSKKAEPWSRIRADIPRWITAACTARPRPVDHTDFIDAAYDSLKK